MRLPRTLCTAASLSLLMSVHACGAKVSTGRNETPSEWPRDNSDPTAPSSTPSKGGTTDANPTNPGATLASGSCFGTSDAPLMPALQAICDTKLKTNPLMYKVHDYLCVRKHMINAMHNPACGWNGDESKIKSHFFVFEREPESSGNDYEDIHALVLNPKVPAAKAIEMVTLAFEDYDAFKQRGFQWVAGTRENKNVNGGKMATGVDFRFRAEKDVYELGYSGHIQMYRLDDKTMMHINYADADFNRVTKFAQVAFYIDQPDGSALIVKIEHKAIASKGLYRRAWQGAMELIVDFMKKAWTNLEMK